jgi:anti-sigma regulatory factor (Ser/Thr protein kinase)
VRHSGPLRARSVLTPQPRRSGLNLTQAASHAGATTFAQQRDGHRSRATRRLDTADEDVARTQLADSLGKRDHMTRSSDEDADRDLRWLTGRDDRHAPRMRRGGSRRKISESVTVPQDLTAPETARRFVAASCDAAGLVGDVRDAAVLLVSEVITNAVVHGLSAPRLTVWTTDSSVRVEVGDLGPDLPVQVDADLDASSGRGLAILDSCASSWGWRLKRQGKVLWFIVRTDQPEDRPETRPRPSASRAPLGPPPGAGRPGPAPPRPRGGAPARPSAAARARRARTNGL